MKYTIQQIAEICDVSIATVSRVFNRHPNVKAEIRQKVLATSAELGYQPRKTTRQQVIGIILPDSARDKFSPYVSTLLEELCSQIEARGYHLLIIPQTSIKLLKTASVTGVILIGFEGGLEKAWEQNEAIPMITLNSTSNNKHNVYSVNSNFQQGIEHAVHYLYEKGHRNIQLLNPGREHLLSNLKRREGFLKACSDLKLPIDESHTASVFTPEKQYTAIGKILQQGSTALIFTGESFSINSLYMLNLFGKKVPDEISLITSEHQNVSKFCLPPLTTIEPDNGKLCSSALDLLETCWNNPLQAHDILVDYKFNERESVKQLAPA